MQSKATTVQKYLAELPPDRRATMQAVRDVIRKNLDKGYEEQMCYGMISYVVPHSIYPPGYHCDPKQCLPLACLASQKNHMAVYLMSVYGSEAEAKRFRSAWEKTGKKLDMGKSCIRFKKAEDLALDVLGDTIRRMPVKTYVAAYEEARGTSGRAAAKASGVKAKPKAKSTLKERSASRARG